MADAPCDHGYATPDDCPRCSLPPFAPPRTVPTYTRWHGTATTLPPRPKVLITLALALPTLTCLLGLSIAGDSPANAFLVVPLFGLLIVSVVVLPSTWQRGGHAVRRHRLD